MWIGIDAVAVDARVGPYRIIRLIKRGGQGSVYLGYDQRLHRRVAIKIYNQPGQRAARKRLLHEARLVASIRSPKVVQVHDVIESREHLALVMEYEPGCDLEEFLGAVQPSLASVLAIGADIAGALALGRQKRIVHGDLKAANVLITESGRVKLTDFGIARSGGSAAALHSLAGSPSALSPEQALGRPLDVRSDLFALGCLLYRMLSGTQPFFRDGRLDVSLLLEESPPPLRELLGAEQDIPQELLDLVTDLLQKDPRDRPVDTHRVRQVMRNAARTIPLAASNSLLREAGPCFRSESADDIPPLVPRDLGREGRSRLAPTGFVATLWNRFALARWPVRSVVALVLLSSVSVPLVFALRSGTTRVHIEQPVLRVAADMDLPPDISGGWLVEALKQGVTEELGEIHVSGPVGATPVTTVYVGGEQEGAAALPREQLHIGLRCAAQLCLVDVSREHAGEYATAQVVLFPDMPVRQWHENVLNATRRLYK
jgi:serine/threonine protein kinase